MLKGDPLTPLMWASTTIHLIQVVWKLYPSHPYPIHIYMSILRFRVIQSLNFIQVISFQTILLLLVELL